MAEDRSATPTHCHPTKETINFKKAEQERSNRTRGTGRGKGAGKARDFRDFIRGLGGGGGGGFWVRAGASCLDVTGTKEGCDGQNPRP